jgi:hypothetical protein
MTTEVLGGNGLALPFVLTQHVPRWVGARISAYKFRGGESQPRVGHREGSRSNQ